MQKKREGLSGMRRRHYFCPLDMKSPGEGPFILWEGLLGSPCGQKADAR